MTLKLTCAISAIALSAALAASTASSAATFYGPTPYLAASDSPFHPGDYGAFFLEDFEDGLLNTAGLHAASTGGTLCVSNQGVCFVGSHIIDSVGNAGNPDVGHSLFSNTGDITLTFDAAVLGGLPTAAGLVWTDGSNPITFQAYDQNNVLLGSLFGTHADNSFAGGTGEDRFYGVANAGGISRLVISNQDGIEIDHIQYGLGAAIPVGGAPEPASWALMITGFGGIGMALRRRRRGGLGVPA